MEKQIKIIDTMLSKYYGVKSIEPYAKNAKKLLEKKEKMISEILQIADEMEKIQKLSLEEKKANYSTLIKERGFNEEKVSTNQKIGLTKARSSALKKVFIHQK